REREHCPDEDLLGATQQPVGAREKRAHSGRLLLPDDGKLLANHVDGRAAVLLCEPVVDRARRLLELGALLWRQRRDLHTCLTKGLQMLLFRLLDDVALEATGFPRRINQDRALLLR